MQYIHSEGLLIDTIKNESRICGITNILSGDAVALLGKSNTVGASSLTFMGNNNTVSGSSVLFGGELNNLHNSFLLNGSNNTLSGGSILFNGSYNALSASFVINGNNNTLVQNSVAIYSDNNKLSSQSTSFYGKDNVTQGRSLSFYTENSVLSSALSISGKNNTVNNSVNIEGSNNILNTDSLNILGDNNTLSVSSVAVLNQSTVSNNKSISVLSNLSQTKNNSVGVNTYNSNIDGRSFAVLENEGVIQTNSFGYGGNNNVLRLSSVAINSANSRLTDNSFSAFTTNSVVSAGSISIGKSNNSNLNVNTLGIYSTNVVASANSVTVNNLNSTLRDGSIGVLSNNAKVSSYSVEMLGTNNVIGLSSIDLLGTNNVIQNKSFSVEDTNVGSNNSVSIKNVSSNFSLNSIGINGRSNTVSDNSVLINGNSNVVSTSSISLGNQNSTYSNSSLGAVGSSNTVSNNSVVLAGSGINASNSSVGVVGTDNTVSNNSVVLAGSTINASDSSVGLVGFKNTISNNSVVLAGSTVSASISSVAIIGTANTSSNNSIVIAGSGINVSNSSIGLAGAGSTVSNNSVMLAGSGINVSTSSVGVGGSNNTISNNSVVLVGSTISANTSSVGVGGVRNVVSNNSVVLAGSGINATNSSVGAVGFNSSVSNNSVIFAGSTNTASNSSVVLAGSAVNVSNSSVGLVGLGNTVSNSSVVLAGSDVNATNSSVVLAGSDVNATNSSVVLAGSAVNASNSSVVLNSTNSTATLSSLIISGQNNTVNNNSMGLGSNNTRLLQNRSLAVGGDDINFNASNSLAVGGQNIVGSGQLFNPNVPGNNITSVGGINNTLGNNSVSVGGRNNIIENSSVFIGGSGNSVGPFNNITMINVTDVQAAENNTAYLPRSFFTGNVTVRGNVSASGNITSIDTLITTEWVARLVNYLQPSAVLYLDQRNTLGNYNVAEFNYLGSPKLFVTRQGVGVNTSSVPAPYVLTFNGSASGTSLALNDTLTFGSNSDTNLYRGTANTLKTDDNLIVAGSVGVGVTTAGTTLDVGGNGRFTSNAQTLHLVGTDHSYIGWYPKGVGSGRQAYTGFPGAGVNYFSIANEITDGTGHISLLPGTDANVGIGTNSPIEKLHVEGPIYIAPSTSKFNPSNNVDTSNLTETYLTLGSGSSNTDWAYLRQIGDNNNYHLSLDMHDDGDASPGGQAFSIRCIGSAVGTPDPTPLTRFHIDSVGRVGIGTASPVYHSRLDISGGGLNIGGPGNLDAAIHIKSSFGGMDRLIQMSPTGVSKPALNLIASTDVNSNNNWWVWGVDSNLWKIQPGTAFSGSNGLFINSSGNVGIGNTNPTSLLSFPNIASTRKIALYDTFNNNNQFFGFGIETATLVYSVDFSGADHVFFSGINSTSRRELMRVKGDGNVGIGTSSPSAKLDVAGTAAVDYLRVDAQDGVNEGGEIQLKGAGSYGDLNIDNFTGNLRLHTLGASNYFEIVGGSSSSPALRIPTGGAAINGNVGIGITSPTQKLHVVDSAASNANGNALFASTGGNASIRIDSANNAAHAYQTLSQGGAGKFEFGIVPTSSDFYINPNVQSSSTGAAIYIQKSTSNVGVKTTNPLAHLNIGLGISNNANNYNTYNSDTGRDGLLFNAYDLGQPNTWRRVCDIVAGGGNTGSEIRFLTSNFWSYTATQKMIITHDGLVGIGVAYPDRSLQVGGAIRSTGHLISNDGQFWSGLSIQNTNTSNTATSFIDAPSRDGAPDSSIFFRHLSNGGSRMEFHTQNPGTFTDRRQAFATLDEYGAFNARLKGYAYGTAGTSYSKAFQIREADLNNNASITDPYRPRLGFHWGNVVASSISLRSDGAFSFDDDPGTGRQTVYLSELYADNWVRTSGNAGWYSQTYGGGWHMTDTTWIRSYGQKNIWLGAGLLGADGGLTVGYGGTASPTGGAIISGSVAIGTSSTAAGKLTVMGGPNDDSVAELYIGGSGGWTAVHNNSTAGSWNPLVAAGNKSIIFSGGTVGTGNLVIAPWSNASVGVKITNLGSVLIGNVGFPSDAPLQVNGGIRTNGGGGFRNSGGYLEYASGDTYLLNHPGITSGGIVFGRANSDSTITEQVYIDNNGRATFLATGTASAPAVGLNPNSAGNPMGMYADGGHLRFGVANAERFRIQNDGGCVGGYFYSNGRYYAAGSGGTIGVGGTDPNAGGIGSIFEQQAASTGAPNYSDGNAAYMIFHRPGRYAVKFGLDTDNVLKVGGWSMGNVSYPIMVSGRGVGQTGGANQVYIGWSADFALKLTVDTTDFSDRWPIRTMQRGPTDRTTGQMTVIDDHHGKVFNVTVATTITLPANCATGTSINVIRNTTGAVEFAAGTGASIVSTPDNTFRKLAFQNSVATAYKLSSTVWLLAGDLLP